jgi:hypothetical protein
MPAKERPRFSLSLSLSLPLCVWTAPYDDVTQGGVRAFGGEVGQGLVAFHRRVEQMGHAAQRKPLAAYRIDTLRQYQFPCTQGFGFADVLSSERKSALI